MADNREKTVGQEKAEKIMALDEKRLIKILKSSKSTPFARAKACQRLAVIGTKQAVSALSALLADPKFGHYARFALEPIPDASVDDTLRRALGQLKGRLLVGVINSIAQRRDLKAAEPLARLLDDPDAEVAAAAAAALGRIATPESAEELAKVLDYTKSVAGSCLECAERLLSQGAREPALALYEALLSRSDLPESVRTMAASGRETARS
ncbi:MAG: HEAT repeat domain-containing protein [Acidobacteria bacterium]|nr:HEAT repeat domain-containing protein [Acidobacteriota bacterium]